MHEAAVFEAKQVFKKNAQREGKLCEFGDALVFEEFEAVNLKRLGADVELVTAAEGVSRVDGHPGDPFAPGEQLSIIAEIASARRGLCCYGLYAPTNAEFLRTLGVCTILGGEFEEGLAHLADRLRRNGSGNGCGASSVPQSEPLISLARQRFIPPDRQGLAALASYAHVVLPSGEHRLAGYTEASRGCKYLFPPLPVCVVLQRIVRGSGS